MYFNNLHIAIYVVIAILGCLVGKFVAWCNMQLPEEKKIFSKEFFSKNKEGLEKNYILMILMALIYVALLYKFGWKSDFYKNMDLIKFMILSPMLVSAFFIDLKHRIIPNRLNLIVFFYLLTYCHHLFLIYTYHRQFLQLYRHHHYFQ